MGERRGIFRVFVGKPEGKGPLGIPRRRWRIILRWILWMWGMDWMELAEYRVRWRAFVNVVMNLQVP
jgi:hypothetical protein